MVTAAAASGMGVGAAIKSGSGGRTRRGGNRVQGREYGNSDSDHTPGNTGK
jgi:hypothetical protein